MNDEKRIGQKGVGTLDIVDLAQNIDFYSQNTLVVIINSDSFG